MKKGKIATLAAFCALFAALCFTACGDEGKENATPLPTNTAVQTETAKPTENPTEMPTVEPTEAPLLEKNYVPVKAKKLSKEFCLLDDAEVSGFEIDEALAYKIFRCMFPNDSEKYMPHNGRWIPEGTRENQVKDFGYHEYKFEYVEADEHLIVLAITDNSSSSDCKTIYTFTYNGELINILWKNKTFAQFAEESLLFTLENKWYYAVVAYSDEEPNGTFHKLSTNDKKDFWIYFSAFWIYEIKDDKLELVWDESVLTEYEELLDNNLSEGDGFFYESNGDGIDFYISEEIHKKENCRFVGQYSFEKLINDIKSGATKRKELEFTDEEILENKMLKAVFNEQYFENYIKYEPKEYCVYAYYPKGNWYDPKDNTKEDYFCEFYCMEDYNLLIARSESGDLRDYYTIATFTKDGELIKVHWDHSELWGGGWESCIFSRENKVYFAKTNPYNHLEHQYSRTGNYFSIVEFGKDSYETVWHEITFFPNCSMEEKPLKTCYDAYSWKFNNENEVDMYFYNENSEEFEYVKSFTFDELLSGVDITDW